MLNLRISKVLVGLAAAVAFVVSASDSSAAENGKVFQDWTIRCDEKATQQVAGGCLMAQFVVDKESKRPVMQVQVAFAPQAQDPIVVVILPLGVLLPAGVSIQVDTNEAVRLPYGWCLPDGCRARMPLDQARLASFKAGAGGKVGFKMVGGRQGTLPFSLKGFTAALSSLQ